MNTKGQQGFTLLEILVVGILVTILAAVTIPRMEFLSGSNKLANSTSEVTSTLYVARMKAVNDSENYGVQFENEGTFRVVRDPYGAAEEFGPVHSLDEGVSFTELSFNDWLAVFTTLGQLDADCLGEGELVGSIYLNNADGDTTVVDVTLVTGRIKETNL